MKLYLFYYVVKQCYIFTVSFVFLLVSVCVQLKNSEKINYYYFRRKNQSGLMVVVYSLIHLSFLFLASKFLFFQLWFANLSLSLFRSNKRSCFKSLVQFQTESFYQYFCFHLVFQSRNDYKRQKFFSLPISAT